MDSGKTMGLLQREGEGGGNWRWEHEASREVPVSSRVGCCPACFPPALQYAGSISTLRTFLECIIIACNTQPIKDLILCRGDSTIALDSSCANQFALLIFAR